MGHNQSSEVGHDDHNDHDVNASAALDQPVAAHDEVNVTSRGLVGGTGATATATTTVREATEPTAEELASLSKACDRLYHIDANRLRWNVDFQINVQGGTSTSGQRDAAREPFVTFITPQALQRPTYAAFIRLLDNYTPAAGVRDTTTPAEESEIRGFLNEAMKTLPMVYAHRYLVAKGAASANVAGFKQQLYDAWFGYYRREAQDDSCGFEHVFVGEIRDGEVIGFHNWLQFYLEEQKGTANYLGYCYARRGTAQSETADPTPNVMTIRFTWHGVAKIKSSLFLGCSPEFELALFTLCFFCGRQGDNVVQIGDYTVNVQSFPIRTAKGNRVGTAFPIALGWDDAIDHTE